MLVHGFNVTQNGSNQIFGRTAALIREEFARYKKTVEVVGFQWPSGAGGQTRWIMKTVAHKLFGEGQDPYTG